MLTRRQLLAGGAATALGVGACRRAEPPGLSERYDVCVIGSSFAGLPVALRTAAAGLRTLVVEAGGHPGEPGSGPGDRFGYTSSGPIDYPLPASRVIALGGSSNHWSGTVNRMRPGDFRVASRYGTDVDWPIDYEELDERYCRAERELSVRGFEPVAGAEPERACPYPQRPPGPVPQPRLELSDGPMRYFPLAHSWRDGAPVRLVDREIAELTAQPAAELLTGLPVTRLVSRDGRSIDHALAREPGGGERRLRAGVFVLAAGVVESARLLLLSCSRFFPEGLGNRRDLVGRFLVEHPTWRWELAPRALEGLFPAGAYDGETRSYDVSDDFRSEGLLATHFQLRASRSGTLILKLQPELESRPGNRVTLSRSLRDGFGDPVPDLQLGFSERDRRTLARGRRLLADQARALGTDPERIARSLQWRSHPAGTLRMAADEERGVVDPDGRVFGLDNLYASGASVFPVSGTANPTLTVVALAHRLADHLLARAGRPR